MLLLLPLYLMIRPKIFIDIFLFVIPSAGVTTKETRFREDDYVWLEDYDVYGVIVDSHGDDLLVSVHDGERAYSVPRY